VPPRADPFEIRDQTYPSRGLSLRYLKGRLGLDERCYKVVEVGSVNVADGDDLQVRCGGGVDRSSCSTVLQGFTPTFDVARAERHP
jgi:hypothetical protein